MAEENQQTAQLLENKAVQEFLKTLMENSPGKGQDYSTLLWQLDGMSRRLDEALHELVSVKDQLAQMQENPLKQSVARMVRAAEGRLHTIQERMTEVKGRIVESAKKALESFGRIGIRALDKVVCALGIKEMLEQTQKDLGESIADVKKSIEKIETIGHELRSVGGHIKNAGRAIAGKERQLIDGGSEGRFQAAVLSPLRLEKSVLTKLNNLTLAAIGNVERLEQAAGHAKESAVPEEKTAQTEEIHGLDTMEDLSDPEAFLEKKPEKGKEKTSLLKELQDRKTQAAVRTVPDKARKVQEASL